MECSNDWSTTHLFASDFFDQAIGDVSVNFACAAPGAIKRFAYHDSNCGNQLSEDIFVSGECQGTTRYYFSGICAGEEDQMFDMRNNSSWPTFPQ